jgi:hypothetical protein
VAFSSSALLGFRDDFVGIHRYEFGFIRFQTGFEFGTELHFGSSDFLNGVTLVASLARCFVERLGPKLVLNSEAFRNDVLENFLS